MGAHPLHGVAERVRDETQCGTAAYVRDGASLAVWYRTLNDDHDW